MVFYLRKIIFFLFFVEVFLFLELTRRLSNLPIYCFLHLFFQWLIFFFTVYWMWGIRLSFWKCPRFKWVRRCGEFAQKSHKLYSKMAEFLEKRGFYCHRSWNHIKSKSIGKFVHVSYKFKLLVISNSTWCEVQSFNCTPILLYGQVIRVVEFSSGAGGTKLERVFA